jgi:hypothetical protein
LRLLHTDPEWAAGGGGRECRWALAHKGFRGRCRAENGPLILALTCFLKSVTFSFMIYVSL